MSASRVFFWQTEKGKKIGPGCLSQWSKCGFVVDGVYYRYAEQYMMAEKARLFEDDATLDKIMDAKSPMIIKRLGRAVKGRNGGAWDKEDAAKWDAVRFDVVVRGNFAKFSQNDELKEYLLSTGEALLAEASPKDSVWGIGVDAETAEKTPQSEWKGQNLLGQALMKVREMLMSGAGDKPEVQTDKGLLAQFVKEEDFQRMVNAEFSKAKSKRRANPAALDEEPAVRSELECEAVKKLVENESRSSAIFVTTRTTLLRRVNFGDKKAFEEFYNVYCPAMLKYLGLTEGSTKEKDQWDIVQTVFTRFYKTFAMVEDPDTGAKRIPRDIFGVLVRTNKETGKTVNIKFRQYLMTCLKNAVRSKWRYETKSGTVSVCSIDTRITPNEPTTWKDKLEAEGVNPKLLDCLDEEGERLEAVWGIWQAVIKGFVFDQSLDDMVRDVTYRSLAEGVPAEELAKYWGIEKNYVYQIKHRGIEKAEQLTEKIFNMLAGEDVDVEKEAKRLYEAVASMTPSKHIDKFMIELAKEICKGRR